MSTLYHHQLIVYAAGVRASGLSPTDDVRWRHFLLWKPSLLNIVDG